MAREPSKGPDHEKRVKRLLEALLSFVAGEFEDDFKIEYDWKQADSPNPKLTIKTTLHTLEWLTQKDKYPDKLTTEQIREALKLLKDFVKILEDNRTQIKGSRLWHFTLKLWSRDKQKNLIQFNKVWQSNKPKKSKELEAIYTEDEGVAVVPQTKLAIFQAPPLPAHFVERPEYSDDLKTRLLTEDNRTLVITAIHGLGSVGKSTLAAALAVDAEIQTRFCDGILWATLGQQPDVLSLISGWVQALGDYSFKPTSVEATTNHLRTLLYDKAVLLVVDDAWNTQDAQAFNVGGLRCQILVTTREGAIAEALAANTYSLDIMKPSQAMALLTKKLRREITGKERQSAENLAQGVGYLPLALELAAAEVASGTTWDELLADIRQEVARLTSFDRPEAEEITDEASLKRLSLTASLNLSVKRMPQEKQQHFAWLGVLPEDVNINKVMAATLWAMDERDAAKILQYLRNKALLLTGVPLADGTPTYRLHDLFHDLACNLLTAVPQPKRIGDLPGLGLKLADAHTALLEKYRQKTHNNLWHTLLDDGYIHQRLVWHLEKAGRVEEIHSLLREESATGNNGWFEAREKLGQTGGYITDISHAWELAEVDWDESTLPLVVSLQCRYALITASLNSLAANLPLKLLVALVQKKVWTPEQGLAYALQNPEPKEKVNALAELVNYLPPNLERLALSEALVTARAIQDERDRVYTLSALVGKLPEVLPEALATSTTIENEYFRADALKALVNKLSPVQLPEVLAATKAIQDESNRTDVLRALIDKLPPQLLLEALVVVRAIHNESNRTDVLIAIAKKLPEVLPEALAATRAIQNNNSRADALIALADQLPELFQEALAATRTIENKNSRAFALIALAAKLPELFQEALTTARTIENRNSRAFALKAIADKLPEVLPEALAASRAIQNDYFRASTLIAIADKLPEVLPEALAASRTIHYKNYRASALSNLADKLPEILPEALATARAIQDEYSCISTIVAIADKRSEVLPEALTTAKVIQEANLRASALVVLADKVPEVVPEALAAARAIQEMNLRASTLIALADQLPEVLSEALAAAKAIQEEDLRAQTLATIVKKVPPHFLPEILAAAKEIQDHYDRVYLLSTIAERLPEVLPEVLAVARAIEDHDYRAHALSLIANKIPEVLPEALATARATQNDYYRAHALSLIANKIPEVLPEALTIARAIQDESNLADVLSSIANKTPEVLPEALTAARKIYDKNSRSKALTIIASGLSQIPSAKLFPLWQDTLHQLSLRTRPNLLSDIKALFPVIFALGGEVATAEIARAIIDVARWWK
ncbi:hypothetical protein H6G41_18040 [Tolypothrix sp. FACHB-123]|uniref:NB-ARC domain-containing protein n=1 Tax=Tolypothrix sp. FACHB-123 TaxID=2692868 RepID=UPI0016820A3F|nr:NB-ARC domain-containing protein [Tolypothrix sp. FACHB-123]MBD2356503.1 hypothetical protein [Tolypothrix sp. FACHB-123]